MKAELNFGWPFYYGVSTDVMWICIANETQELYASHTVHGRLLCPTEVLHFCAKHHCIYLFIYLLQDYSFSFLSYTYTLTLKQRLCPSVELNFDTIHIHSYFLCPLVIKRMFIPVFIAKISVLDHYWMEAGNLNILYAMLMDRTGIVSKLSVYSTCGLLSIN